MEIRQTMNNANRIDTVFSYATYLFDPLHFFWEKEETQQKVAGILVIIFLAALAVIELNRQHLLPSPLDVFIPLNHYKSISLAFTLVLILEVISLIFTLPCSISKALGKQFEILALIFLRGAFKQLEALPEPISIEGHLDVLWSILATGGGAIAIFALLGVYAIMLAKTEDKTRKSSSLFRFVAAKKIVSLILLAIFILMGCYNGWFFFTGQETFHFFQDFYTLLIFSDILLVLIAQCFMPEFKAIFRNSGYTLATLLIRLSLTAPRYYDIIIGVSSALFALSLTVVYNKFYRGKSHYR